MSSIAWSSKNSSFLQVEEGGFSQEADLLFSSINNIFHDIKTTDQNWMFNELEELSVVASTPNWDNLGSAPLENETYQAAKRFLLAWPSNLPSPEITSDRDGEVNFDWFGSNGQIFSVSLRKDGRLAFAGQFASRQKISGMEEFNNAIPKQVVDSVRDTFAK